MNYLLLLEAKSATLQAFYQLFDDAEANRNKETEASIRLQCQYRAYKVRVRMRAYKKAILKLQQLMRGIEGRNRMASIMHLQDQLTQESLRNYHVATIQRVFRGWYSRKYRYSHARRKQYKQHIEQKGIEVLQMMHEYATAQQLREAEEEKDRKLKRFTDLASNLHHLVSTRTVRGVFNPPPEFVEPPTAYDVSVEANITGAVKDLLRTNQLTRHTGLVADINGALKVPFKGLKSKLSLQASAPYDAIEQEKRREKRLNTLKNINPDKGFLAGGRTKLLASKIPSMTSQEPFTDAWANPLLRRGELHPAPNISSRPFLSSVGGNMSSAVANDLFDTIADAQETGGAAQRHLGKSSRFGVSDNADVRSTLAPHPLRVNATFSASIKARTGKTAIALDVSALFAKDSIPLNAFGGGDSSDDEFSSNL